MKPFIKPKKEKPEDKPVDVMPEVEQKGYFCECGSPVHPGSHQCWACAHRS